MALQFTSKYFGILVATMTFGWCTPENDKNVNEICTTSECLADDQQVQSPSMLQSASAMQKTAFTGKDTVHGDPRYQAKNSGSCDTHVSDLDECSAAAQALGFDDTTASNDGQDAGHRFSRYDPPGCYFESRSLKFNDGGNTGFCKSSDTCICKLADDPADEPYDGPCCMVRMPSGCDAPMPTADVTQEFPAQHRDGDMWTSEHVSLSECMPTDTEGQARWVGHGYNEACGRNDAHTSWERSQNCYTPSPTAAPTNDCQTQTCQSSTCFEMIAADPFSCQSPDWQTMGGGCEKCPTLCKDHCQKSKPKPTAAPEADCQTQTCQAADWPVPYTCSQLVIDFATSCEGSHWQTWGGGCEQCPTLCADHCPTNGWRPK